MHHLDCACELPGELMIAADQLHLIGPGCQRARRARFASLYRHLAEAAVEIETARRSRHRRRRPRRPRVTSTTLA